MWLSSCWILFCSLQQASSSKCKDFTFSCSAVFSHSAKHSALSVYFMCETKPGVFSTILKDLNHIDFESYTSLPSAFNASSCDKVSVAKNRK